MAGASDTAMGSTVAILGSIDITLLVTLLAIGCAPYGCYFLLQCPSFLSMDCWEETALAMWVVICDFACSSACCNASMSVLLARKEVRSRAAVVAQVFFHNFRCSLPKCTRSASHVLPAAAVPYQVSIAVAINPLLSRILMAISRA